MSRGQFFAVDIKHFENVCDLGLHPALAYLVVAAGTGGDNRTSSWSANAVQTYTGMRFENAKRALVELMSGKMMTRDPKSSRTRPRYLLQKPDHQILVWMPKALVTGIDTERLPLERLRRSHSLPALRLLVRLYAVHDLKQEGGIPTKILFQNYTRQRIVEHGMNVVWAFSEDQSHRYRVPIFDGLGDVETWDVLQLLIDLGLVYWVPYLFDADHEHGEPIHPISDEVAEAIFDYGEAVGEASLPSVLHATAISDYVIPVERTTTDPHVIGIFQLRYLPHAAYSLEGMNTRWHTSQNAVNFYRDLAEGKRAILGGKLGEKSNV